MLVVSRRCSDDSLFMTNFLNRRTDWSNLL